MPRDVIALKIGAASIPLYADDWPAVKSAVEAAMGSHQEGLIQKRKGEVEVMEAARYRVADQTRFHAVDRP